jgi:hypothetical protein
VWQSGCDTLPTCLGCSIATNFSIYILQPPCYLACGISISHSQHRQPQSWSLARLQSRSSPAVGPQSWAFQQLQQCNSFSLPANKWPAWRGALSRPTILYD